MTEQEVETLLNCSLADDRFQQIAARHAPNATRETSDGEVHFISRERGLEIYADAEDGLVNALVLFVQPSPQAASGDRPFAGPLPYQIPPDAGHVDVAGSVGRTPDRVTPQTDTWYQDGYRLVVSYRSGRIASLVAATRPTLPVTDR